jgi:Fe-S cluster biogenesis protein NfuA
VTGLAVGGGAEHRPVTGLAAQVMAALERSVLPSVIARGASVRVTAADDGVVTLEVTGSPGAVFPLASRIEAAIRAAVPEVTNVRLVPPGTGERPVTTGSAPPRAPADDAEGAASAQRILDAEVNPAIAAHRGHVTIADAAEGWIRIRLEGGCQGCSLAEVTLRQGIEPLLRARLPGIVGVIDVTDHEAGTEPFFSPAKR